MSRSAKQMTIRCDDARCTRSLTLSCHTDQQFNDELQIAGWQIYTEKLPLRDGHKTMDFCPEHRRAT
jgi:hypothetical protein